MRKVPAPLQAPADTKAIHLGHPSYVWRHGQERRLAQIRQYLSLEGKRILDVGCGLGMYLSRFQQFTDHVYGVDIDEAKLAQARLNLPNLCQAPAEALPFDSDSFDVVVLNEVIEHVKDDRAAIQESVRCLAPGGHVVIYAPNRLYPYETHGFFFRGRYHFRLLPLINWTPNPIRNRFCPHARVYTAPEIKALFRGLEVRFVAITHIFPGLDNWAARGWLGRILRDTAHTLERTPLRVFGISHFVVAQKLPQAAQQAEATPKATVSNIGPRPYRKGLSPA